MFSKPNPLWIVDDRTVFAYQEMKGLGKVHRNSIPVLPFLTNLIRNFTNFYSRGFPVQSSVRNVNDLSCMGSFFVIMYAIHGMAL